jgi:putative membrane protein
MKKYKKSMSRLTRGARVGAALSAAIFAACALQAQYTGPTDPQTPLPGTSAEISHPAKEFLQFAGQANQTEIAMANVAEARSHNAAVKEMAQMMRRDHQQNYAQLQVIAQNHLIALDSSLDSANQRAVNRLKETSDEDFDKDYATVMLKDHVHCIKKFDKAVAQIDEAYVKEYAQNTLPTLRKHLRHAEDTARSVGVDEAAISAILKALPIEEAERSVTFNDN